MTSLTEREEKMLRMLAGGADAKAIAKAINSTPGSTRVYLHGMYRKLKVHNKLEAVVQYYRGRVEELERKLKEKPC